MDKATWEFINSFAPWLSAIGTLLVVILSLYLLWYQNRTKLSIYASISVLFQNQNSEDELTIRITNVGSKNVNVNSLLWGIGYFKKAHFFQTSSDHIASTILPKTISYGEVITIVFNLNDFRKSNIKIFAKEISRPFRRIKAHSIRILINTSIGKPINYKIDKYLRDWFLNEAEAE